VAGVYIHDTMLVEGIDKRRVTHSERAPRIQHGLFCGAGGGESAEEKSHIERRTRAGEREESVFRRTGGERGSMLDLVMVNAKRERERERERERDRQREKERRCRFAEHCGIGNRVFGLSFGIPPRHITGRNALPSRDGMGGGRGRFGGGCSKGEQ